jgi:hypothetical protein
MKDKKFNAVRMMREIRDKLSEIYTKDPEAEKRDLEAMREIRDKLSEIYTKDPEAEKRDLEAIRVKYRIKG